MREVDGAIVDYTEEDDFGTINDTIFEKDLPSEFFNAVIHTYKMCFGEFNTEGFRGDNEMFLGLVFILATFLLPITFFNMLIAIMQNIFNQMMDIQHTAILRERIGILSDFRLVVRWLKLDNEFQYIYVIRPLSADN